MHSIGKSFDKGARTYRDRAGLQRSIAAECVKNIAGANSGQVLEVGAGGGFVFEEFLRRQKKYRNYLALDISEKMLRLVPEKNIFRVRGDGEIPPFSAPIFDTLVSSSSIQWFKNPATSIPGCLQLLRPSGRFSLAFFVAGTFPEMTRAAEASGFGAVHELPGVEPCLGAVKKLCPDVNHEINEKAVRYSSPLAFLKSHKKTGATWTKGPKRPNKKGLKDFLAFYAENFRDQKGGVIATYKILYLSGIVDFS